MALKAIIAKLDEVDEKYRDLYVEKDGKFELQVEGMKTQADIDRQLAANTKERTAHDETKKKLKAAETKIADFGDLDPDDVTSKLEKLQQLEAAGTNPDASKIQGLVDAAVQERIKRETQKLTRSLETTSEQVRTLTAERDGLTTRITQREMDDHIRASALEAKVIDAAVPDLLILSRGEFTFVDGKPQTSDGRTPGQWLEDRKKVSPYYWPQAKGAGAQGGNGEGGGGPNPFTHDGWNQTAQSQAYKANPAKAIEMAKSVGAYVEGSSPSAPRFTRPAAPK